MMRQTETTNETRRDAFQAFATAYTRGADEKDGDALERARELFGRLSNEDKDAVRSWFGSTQSEGERVEIIEEHLIELAELCE